eukprot:3662721-Rhodomonas_salina.2
MRCRSTLTGAAQPQSKLTHSLAIHHLLGHCRTITPRRHSPRHGQPRHGGSKSGSASPESRGQRLRRHVPWSESDLAFTSSARGWAGFWAAPRDRARDQRHVTLRLSL